jgi:hypothetical protein
MTSEHFAQRRLFSQQLIGPKATKPADVLKWLCAVQAQDYAGAKWAIGMRMQRATDEDVEQDFAAGKILRTHLLRPTWHFVTPDDIRWLLKLTAPRVHAANAHMYRKIGLDSAIFKRSRSVLIRALQGGQQLTRDELRVVFQKNRILTDVDMRMTYLMMNAELDGLVCSGMRRGKQFTYALLDERVPLTRNLERDQALAELARRFFASRGPATVHDFAKWSGLTVTDARTGLESVKHDLECEIADGKEYWLGSSNQGAFRRSRTAHLLSIYDEYFSGYKDRSAVINREDASRLSAMDNALGYVVVMGGQVVGTWKRRFEKDIVVIKTAIFRQLSTAEDRAVKAAARTYGDFLGMKVLLE